MFTIEQSPFLHALGYAIGHSLWQMSLLWLVYTAIVHLHQWTSSQRYNLAVTAASTGFAWFIVTLFYYANNISLQQDAQLATGILAPEKSFTPAGKFIFIYHSAMATLRSLAPYFSCAYLFVMLVLSIRLANGFNQVKQLRTEGLSKASVDSRLFVEKHAELLGIKKPVHLFISNIASSPLTIGFWKPFILVPIASINQLTPQQLEAVLLHELAHIRRNDYLFNIILQLAEITLFFNPFMRLLLKQARLERENSCDDYVLQFQYNAAEYAKALLAIEQHSVESLLALGTNNQNEFQLLTRIKRMVAPERRAFNYRQQLGLLFLITLLGLGFTVINPRQQNQKTTVETSNRTTQPLIREKAIATTATGLIPQAVDLVKNLENLKVVKDIVTSKEFTDKAKKLGDDMQKAGDKFSIQMQPHIKQIEKIALEIANLAKQPYGVQDGVDMNNFQLNSNQLNEVLTKADWSKVVAPVFEQSEAIMALIPGVLDKENWPVIISTPSPASTGQPRIAGIGMNREQLLKMNKLQQKLNKEQQRLVRMTEMERLLADSMRVAFSQQNNQIDLAFADAIARAKKEAAIAPFRQREPNTPTEPPARYYRFSYSNANGADSKTDEEEEDQNDQPNYTNVYNANQRIEKNNNTCAQPEANRKKVKTVTVFNGKAFSDKVKQVWAEAQQQAKAGGEGWTNEMKKQVAHEIEKELKELEHVEIKTRISTKPDNTKSIVIEVETM